MTLPNWNDLASGTGFLLIFLGFAFTLIPVLPGSLVALAGMVVYAASQNFAKPTPSWLVFIGCIALVAWLADWVLSALIARKTGATWKTILGAIVGGLVGAATLSAVVPIIGTLVGAALGTALGAFITEYALKGNVQPALKTSGAYLLGCFFSRLVEIALCLTMLGIFVWRIS